MSDQQPKRPLTPAEIEDYRLAAEMLANGLAKLMRLVPDWEDDNDLAMVLLSASKMAEQCIAEANLVMVFPPLPLTSDPPDDLPPN